MKKILSVILILVLNSSFFSLYDSSEIYDDGDIVVLQELYNHNAEVLAHWDLSIPNVIEEIEWVCIDDINRLVSIDLSNTDIKGNIDLSEFEYIEDYDFSNTKIKEITLPNSADRIPQGAFENCCELEYIDIPDTISTIENNAFKNCFNLKSIILNNSIAISSEVFSGCISLESIVNANNIKSIGRNAFSNCDKLVFYDDNIANTYIKNYTQNMNYLFSNNTLSNAECYAAIMTNGKNQSSYGYPYKNGIAYLYDNHNILINQMNLDTEGHVLFENLSIGHKYKLVIDGEFAIARTFSFVATQENNIIRSKEEALPIVICDFNQDGIITNADVQILFSKLASGKPNEANLYDLNNDGIVTVSDAGVVYSLIAYFYEKGYMD